MAFRTETRQNVPVALSGLLECAGGVAHGFSTRRGGVSRGVWSELNLGALRGDEPERVAENWRRFCAAVGTDPRRVVKVKQIHGDRICAVTEQGLAQGQEADGLVTDVPGVALAVLTADCIPVLLCDPQRRCVAAVHSGWRGTALAIAERAVERMVRDYGCRPDRIVAAVGPGICPTCFETDEDVPRAMTAALGARAEGRIRPLGKGRYQVDLKGIVTDTLIAAGLDRGNIDVSPDCTACMGETYWSHRRLGDRRGSMAAVIALKDEK